MTDLRETGIELEVEDSEEFELEVSEPMTVVTKTDGDYEQLYNKPRINGVELRGNRELEELGIESESPVISQLEILNIFNKTRGE